MNAIKRNIPNAITCLNLLFGCIALIFIFQNKLEQASYMIVLAAIADFLDGMAARLLNVHSAIGKELDSLADMVSFGVVPGMMVFKLINNEYCEWIGLCIPIFAALRLAKFNVDARQATYFIGVPTPAISLLIISFPLILSHSTYWQNIYLARGEQPVDVVNIDSISWFLGIISIVCSALMVMPLPLISMKFKNMSWGSNKARYILLILSLASTIVFRFESVPIIMVLYVVLSLFANPAKETHE